MVSSEVSSVLHLKSSNGSTVKANVATNWRCRTRRWSSRNYAARSECRRSARNVGAIETLREAVRTQGEKIGIRWADALSISVRPVITYWFMALYCAAKTAAFAAAVNAGAGWGTAILHAWTEADQALWAGVLNFWFLGRVFDRVRP